MDREFGKIQRPIGRAAILILIAALLSASLLWTAGSVKRTADPGAPRDYIYGMVQASNGMELHYLRTRPSNIRPEYIDENVTLTPYYGINGGFFYGKDLLSIAVVNDIPVYRTVGAYGGGGANVKYGRGTLVWDGVTGELSVQVARQASELAASDRSRYWAQGGISMSLGNGHDWEKQAAAENAPFADEDRLRSAAVFDLEGNVYLIVSRNPGSLSAFREAILERIGNFRLKDGIFLDGDGSSQLRSRQMELPGDGRSVAQMLRILQ